MERFLARILDRVQNRTFIDDLVRFQRSISHFGMLNGLAQTLLKITLPGVPDFYQGTELWDLSLVDPDNRHPVDYGKRQRLLRELDAALEQGDRRTYLRQLLETKEDGRIKLLVTAMGLRFRRSHPGLLGEGDYIPAEVTGAHSDHIFAFARLWGSDIAIVIVPRLMFKFGTTPLGDIWEDTRLSFSGLDMGTGFRNVFTGQATKHGHIRGILADFPLALLHQGER
jgi:(1->4)-alpha-D-glucan 1-alpha-D-glucosylmutase